MALLAGLSLSCSKSLDDPEALERNETVLERMASNIGFFRDLAVAVEAEGKVAAWLQDTDHVTVYWDNGRVSTVWPDPTVEDVVPPTVSSVLQDGRLVWAVNGEVLTKGGKAFPVSDASAPVLLTEGADWLLTLAGERFTYRPDVCVKAHRSCVGIDTSRPLTFRLESGTEVYVEQPAWYADLKTRDVNRAFYKDIFLDAGIGLTDRTSLYAANYLGLSLEGISGNSESYKALFQGVIGGTPEDTNGRLLYPDGQPRFRVLFVDGGNSRSHGKSLGDKALGRMRDFNAAGGSYVGTCAGGFFAASGYDDESDYPYYLHLWPGVVLHTGLETTSTGMFIEEDSPLLTYYDFGGDGYLAEVRHNKGGFPASLSGLTEVLALYDCPDNSYVHRKPSVWAFKSDASSGRVVMEGSHPEEAQKGENRDLTAAMIRYAMDGQGTTFLQSVLRNGLSWQHPVGLGDLQCHHFAFYLTDPATVSFSVSGRTDEGFCLSLSRDGFAYPSVAEYSSEGNELRVADLPAGLWYASVQSLATVKTEMAEYGMAYTGNTGILNGIPYTVTVSWK